MSDLRVASCKIKYLKYNVKDVEKKVFWNININKYCVKQVHFNKISDFNKYNTNWIINSIKALICTTNQ